MPFTEGTVTSLVLDQYVCDRCGKSIKVERDPLNPPDLPAGWKSVGHPGSAVVPREPLVFDRRDCMGVWFSTYVRVLYGGPEELPARKPRRKKVSPKRAEG